MVRLKTIGTGSLKQPRNPEIFRYLCGKIRQSKRVEDYSVQLNESFPVVDAYSKFGADAKIRRKPKRNSRPTLTLIRICQRLQLAAASCLRSVATHQESSAKTLVLPALTMFSRS